MLAVVLAEPRANFMYGTFLAGVGKGREAIPYLEKAYAVGAVDAVHVLGLTQLCIAECDRALKSLQEYKRRKPRDPAVDKLIEDIRSGNVEVRVPVR